MCAVPFLSIYLFIGISAITLEGTGRFLSESTVSYFLRVCFHPRFAAPLQGCEAARSWQRPAAALERSRCGFLRQGEAKFVPQPITPFLELPQSCCCQRCCLWGEKKKLKLSGCFLSFLSRWSVARCFVKAAWQKKAETLRNVTRLNLVYEMHPWADRNVLMLSPSPQSLLAASRETLVLGKACCYV